MREYATSFFGVIVSLLASVDAAGEQTTPIKHVIVLFEENRAFDHLFGWSREELGVNGLFGNESNPSDPDHPETDPVFVSTGAPYVATFDPTHAFPVYNYKTFGTENTTQIAIESLDPEMLWFYDYESGKHPGEAEFVMQGFSPEDLPVSFQLAQEFAIFDSWHTAFPGPSWPNHLFSMTATSAGCTETGSYYEDTGCYNSSASNQLYPQKTIFESLADDGLTWNMIYNDSFGESYINFFTTEEGAAGLHDMDTFFAQAKEGTLPTLTWITPREGVNASMGALGGPNSDHPSCCDVALGERLRKDIYEALRSGPAWNETAFIMTWDDPGGFFDHAKPPQSAPAPDNCSSYPDAGFQFNRLGSRIPVIIASPRIPRGTVVTDPPAGSSEWSGNSRSVGDVVDDLPPSKYDSTSIVGTIKDMFNLTSYLTARDTWSGKFDSVFSLEDARTDAPLHLNDAPPPAGIWPDQDDDDDDDCDQPRRRMKRSILLFEHIHNVTAPPRLHSCAHTQPHWKHKCDAGTMAEASAWLAEQTALLAGRGRRSIR